VGQKKKKNLGDDKGGFQAIKEKIIKKKTFVRKIREKKSQEPGG